MNGYGLFIGKEKHTADMVQLLDDFLLDFVNLADKGSFYRLNILKFSNKILCEFLLRYTSEA